MPEDWFEVAYINFDEAILHGRAVAGRDEFGVRHERQIRRVLTDDEKRRIEDLNSKHQVEMQSLLRALSPIQGEG